MFLATLDALDRAAGGIIVPSLALGAEGAEKRIQRIELEHLAIIEAIARGDEASAEAAMRLHLLSARNRALSMRW